MSFNGYVVRFEAHKTIAMTMTATVKEGQLVMISGAKSAAPCAAGKVHVGVSMHAVDSGQKASVRIRGDIMPLIAEGTVTAGDELVPGAVAGSVKKRTAETVGEVCAVAYENGADGQKFNAVVL